MYIYSCTCRSGSYCCLSIFQRNCSNSTLNVCVFGSDGPFLDYFRVTGLMEMLLWTVGSFYVFDEKCDLTWPGFFQSDSTVLRRNSCSGDSIFVKLHHAQVGEDFLFRQDSHLRNTSVLGFLFCDWGSLQAPRGIWSCCRRFTCVWILGACILWMLSMFIDVWVPPSTPCSMILPQALLFLLTTRIAGIGKHDRF